MNYETKEYEIITTVKGNSITVNVKNNNEIRIKIGHTYTIGNDATIIWEWIYKGDELIRERIVGYYHGEPDKNETKKYAFRGVEGILDLDFDEIYED